MFNINQISTNSHSKHIKKYQSNYNTDTNNQFKLNLIHNKDKTAQNIDNINEKLENGNLDAVEELENLGISYTQEEHSNGYKINYEFEDTNYTISYTKIETHNKNIENKVLDNESYDIILKIFDEANLKNQEELFALKPPAAPNSSIYNNESDYQVALNKYYDDLNIYNEKIEQYNKETGTIEYLSKIISEKQKLDNFNKNINTTIKELEQSPNSNKSEAIEQIKNYANDFKSKIQEKIYYQQQFNNNLEALNKLEIPQAPTMNSSKSEVDYQKELKEYEANYSKYDMEQTAINLRLQMINKKIQILNAILDNMYSSDYESSASIFW